MFYGIECPVRISRTWGLWTAAIGMSGWLLLSSQAGLAQGMNDTFSVYQQADAQAACDNANLPRQGFTILQVVPNTRNKDCYWQRSGQPPASDSSSQSTLESAIRMARARQQNSLREIEQSRSDGWSMFWRHFNGCGGEPTCESEVIRARITIERDLDAAVARVNQRFLSEIETLRQAQVRPELPGGAPARN